jgi:hypothetical protein
LEHGRILIVVVIGLVILVSVWNFHETI